MSSAQYRFKSENGKAVVEFLSPFDDNIDFSKINLGFVIEVDFIFEKVNYINSKGIKKWIDWVSRFSKGTALRYHRVTKPLVDQVNMVLDFLPDNAKVISFYVPFYSEETAEEKNVLLTFGSDFIDAKVHLPSVKDSEGNDMNLDVHDKKYFAFLRKS